MAIKNDAIGSADIIKLIGIMNRLFKDNRDRLIELDSQLGDGDLGIYMASGMHRAFEEIKEMDMTPGKLLRRVGMIFAEEAPSTMGTLIAGAFMAAGKSVEGKDLLNVNDIVLILQQIPEAIMKRGGAKEGEKTILDSLMPAARSARSVLGETTSLVDVCESAYQAAIEGMEAAKDRKAIHGRPGYFGEKSIGKYDGGTVVGVLLCKAFAGWAKKGSNK